MKPSRFLPLPWYYLLRPLLHWCCPQQPSLVQHSPLLEPSIEGGHSPGYCLTRRPPYGAQADISDLDISIESNQRRVVREFLLEKGFTDDQIKRKLEKYEDADILEDEAADAIESLKEIKAEKQKALLENQKKANEQMIQEQQAFYNNVVNEIEALTDIRGIQIPKNDKQV